MKVGHLKFYVFCRRLWFTTLANSKHEIKGLTLRGKSETQATAGTEGHGWMVMDNLLRVLKVCRRGYALKRACTSEEKGLESNIKNFHGFVIERECPLQGFCECGFRLEIKLQGELTTTHKLQYPKRRVWYRTKTTMDTNLRPSPRRIYNYTKHASTPG